MVLTPSILITDDDRDFRETLCVVFERQGFAPVLAADGEEAIRIVKHEMIHVVLIDFHMPRLSGIEAIEQIRKLRAHLPCILISAAEEAQQGATLAFRVLRKPVSRAVVTGTVEAALAAAYGWSP
jgi:CheY-like chemotaxis protein